MQRGVIGAIRKGLRAHDLRCFAEASNSLNILEKFICWTL
jgi:hypothetical protein